MDCPLFDLPNEILLDTLNLLSSKTLLEIAPTSHRFYVLILKLLRSRLQAAARIPDHMLLLECYRPSAKLTEPHLHCTYVGTNGLDNDGITEEQDPLPNRESCRRLGDYRRFYSSFKPRSTPHDYARRWRHPAGDVPGSRTHPLSSTRPRMDISKPNGAVKQVLSLESHEMFTQLVASLNLARSGPRSGLFFSIVELSDGVLRVWREWLKNMDDGSVNVGSSRTSENGTSNGTDSPLVQVEDDETILWIDQTKKAGLRLKVRQKKWRRDVPVLMAAEEEVSVNYEVEYEELLVRTSHLVMTMEESLLQQNDQSGKAVVFGSFR